MSGKRQSTGSTTKTLLIIAIILLVIVLGVLCFALLDGENSISEALTPTQTYVAGTSVQGVDIGGMTYEEAQAALGPLTAPVLGKLSFVCQELTIELDASPATGKYEWQKALDSLSHLLVEIGMFTDEDKLPAPEQIEAELTYDTSKLVPYIYKIALDMSYDPVNASLGIISEKSNQSPEAATVNTAQQSSPEGQPVVGEEVPAAVDGPHIQGIEGIFEYVHDQDGRSVDPKALTAIVDQWIADGAPDGKVVEVPYEFVPAAVTVEQISSQFTLISTASSSFAKGSYSKANRVFNMNLASEKINGYVLAPGEEFSFNTVLGPRSKSTGWKEAGAILDGASVQEVGGGICQVSSTAFNSVLMADLEIVTRYAHSYPLSYLPTGQDATISTGGPDFVFKNNKSTPIILVADCDEEAKTITVSIYGPPLENGVRIELVSERISSSPQPPDEYVMSAEVPAGQTTILREGRSGSKWETYKVYYQGDTEVNRQLSHTSTYRAMSERIGVSPSMPASGTTTPPSGSGSGGSGSANTPEIPDEEELLDIDVPFE